MDMRLRICMLLINYYLPPTT